MGGTLHDSPSLPASGSVANDPEFLALKAQVSDLTTTVSSHTTELTSIRSTVDGTSSDVEAIKGILHVLAQRAQQPSAAVPVPAAIPGELLRADALDAAHAAARVVAPLVSNTMIDNTLHESMLAAFGVALARVQATSVAQSVIDDGPVPFRAWWHRLGTLKSLQLWQAKLRMFGCPETDLPDSIEAIGIASYRHLLASHLWSVASVQAFTDTYLSRFSRGPYAESSMLSRYAFSFLRKLCECFVMYQFRSLSESLGVACFMLVTRVSLW